MNTKKLKVKSKLLKQKHIQNMIHKKRIVKKSIIQIKLKLFLEMKRLFAFLPY